MHELSMARMAQSAYQCRVDGREDQAAYWDERIEQANLAEQRAEHKDEWACLKGSPEHG